MAEERIKHAKLAEAQGERSGPQARLSPDRGSGLNPVLRRRRCARKEAAPSWPVKAAEGKRSDAFTGLRAASSASKRGDGERGFPRSLEPERKPSLFALNSLSAVVQGVRVKRAKALDGGGLSRIGSADPSPRKSGRSRSATFTGLSGAQISPVPLSARLPRNQMHGSNVHSQRAHETRLPRAGPNLSGKGRGRTQDWRKAARGHSPTGKH